MKTNNLSNAVLLLILFFSFQFSYASFGGGSIMGRVIDPDTKQPVSDAVVVLDCHGTQTTFVTNEQGYYYASNIPAGIYNVSVSYMSNKAVVANVALSSDEQREINLSLDKAIGLTGVIIVEDQIPLLNPVDPTGTILRRQDFTEEPITKIADITSMQVGVTDINGQFYVRGAREGSLVYYIDGAPVLGNPDIPLCGLETYRIYTGFIPPKYGDSTGGIVVMETRNYFAEQHD